MVTSVLLVAGALGCGGTPMEHQIAANRGRGYTRPLDTLGLESAVSRPAAHVWSVLPAVMADLGLEINFRVPAERRMGACHQRVRARLGTAMLSSLVNCGETNSVPNADRYDVALTVLTTVRSTGETAALHTFVLGVALDASGAASNRIWCHTRGALEERIRRGVEQRLADS